MKENPENQALWRQNPTAAERAGLRLEAEQELETRLTDALGKIPDARVPSNFTARVLDAIDLEEARQARSRSHLWTWRFLMPRAAAAAMLLVLAFGLFMRHETNVRNLELAQNVVLLAAATPPPAVDVLDNFDAIQSMSRAVGADEDILALQ